MHRWVWLVGLCWATPGAAQQRVAVDQLPPDDIPAYLFNATGTLLPTFTRPTEPPAGIARAYCVQTLARPEQIVWEASPGNSSPDLWVGFVRIRVRVYDAHDNLLAQAYRSSGSIPPKRYRFLKAGRVRLEAGVQPAWCEVELVDAATEPYAAAPRPSVAELGPGGPMIGPGGP